MNINDFLNCRTPDAWLDAVPDNLHALLVDHANCERKAAATAISLMQRPEVGEPMALRLSKLAREELRHFEQVLGVMRARGLAHEPLSPSRYAAGLRGGLRSSGRGRLVDSLIVAAIIEARSCERFERLVTVTASELSEFYAGLLKSEARHFLVYLDFAKAVATAANDAPLDDRVGHFLALDEELVTSADRDFRFHSGVPVKG